MSSIKVNQKSDSSNGQAQAVAKEDERYQEQVDASCSTSTGASTSASTSNDETSADSWSSIHSDTNLPLDSDSLAGLRALFSSSRFGSVESLRSSIHESKDDPLVVDDWEELEFMLEMNRIHLQVEALSRSSKPVVLPFPTGRTVQEAECEVCFETLSLDERACCSSRICSPCITTYCNTQVLKGQVRIQCPAHLCDSWLCEDEILHRLDMEYKQKFYKFLSIQNAAPDTKTCPGCCIVTKIPAGRLNQSHTSRTGGVRHQCVECRFIWCLKCHSPLHPGISCKKYSKGDKLLKQWAKGNVLRQNAQRCPKCKVYIERISGCDHMTCYKCNTDFCYQCGNRFRSSRFLGNHYSPLSLFGCTKRYFPNKPHLRRFLRGLIFFLKIVAVVPCCCLVFVVAIVAGPVYGFIRLHRHLQRKRRAARSRRKVLAERQRRAAGAPRPDFIVTVQQSSSDNDVPEQKAEGSSKASIANISLASVESCDSDDGCEHFDDDLGCVEVHEVVQRDTLVDVHDQMDQLNETSTNKVINETSEFTHL